MKQKLILLALVLASCTERRSGKSIDTTAADTVAHQTVAADTAFPDTEIIETIADSLLIGVKGENKIELIKHRVFDETYVIVKFYRKAPRGWYIQNTYLYPCTAMMDLAPEFADFNNDSLNDITFVSAQAARGANEVRRLFIYNKEDNDLTSIVNAESYPNMRYNKELDCIDAFLVHGGSSTVFARIAGDSLIEFASVHNDSHRTVYEIDKRGKERLLRQDKIDPENVYVRYLNYKPLKEYTE